MQRAKLFKIVGVSLFSLSTAIMPLAMPASAQVNAPGTSEVETRTDYRDDGFDWGWLGLLGLIGLAGLAGKKRNEPTAYREPDVVNRTTYRE
ncbi:MAG: WGxxGxxG-CTERM domain-containing protein [Hydrococcus sp. Prado102]|nr:WGxxGxxG-CTERM domain-containing protein [Hydrococcus sp. Prado102]